METYLRTPLLLYTYKHTQNSANLISMRRITTTLLLTLALLLGGVGASGSTPWANPLMLTSDIQQNLGTFTGEFQSLFDPKILIHKAPPRFKSMINLPLFKRLGLRT